MTYREEHTSTPTERKEQEWIPADLLLVLQHVSPLDPLLFLALWWYTGVFLAVGHTRFLCSGPVGVTSLVTLVFGVFFPCQL